MIISPESADKAAGLIDDWYGNQELPSILADNPEGTLNILMKIRGGLLQQAKEDKAVGDTEGHDANLQESRKVLALIQRIQVENS